MTRKSGHFPNLKKINDKIVFPDNYIRQRTIDVNDGEYEIVKDKLSHMPKKIAIKNKKIERIDIFTKKEEESEMNLYMSWIFHGDDLYRKFPDREEELFTKEVMDRNKKEYENFFMSILNSSMQYQIHDIKLTELTACEKCGQYTGTTDDGKKVSYCTCIIEDGVLAN